MTARSPFDFDISVTADKLRRARRRGLTGAVETSARACDHPGCRGAGQYRAPRSPMETDSFYWFCLDHVRDYNRAWNWNGGLTPDEVDRIMEADRLWGRQTWRTGTRGGRGGANPHADGRAWARFGFEDPLDVLGARATINPGDRPASFARLPPVERRALDILGAHEGMTKAEIRRLYRDLVKQLHPDTNGGSREAESRLQEVVGAWERVRASRLIPA